MQIRVLDSTKIKIYLNCAMRYYSKIKLRTIIITLLMVLLVGGPVLSSCSKKTVPSSEVKKSKPKAKCNCGKNKRYG
jgi:hypothetical protein